MPNTEPTVVLQVGRSFFTRSGDFVQGERTREILETVELLPNGRPDWSEAGICDERGAGGATGIERIDRALHDGEFLHVISGGGPIERVTL